jgi:hypothetical protein
MIQKCLYLGAYAECTHKPKMRTELLYGCTNTSCLKHPLENGQKAVGKFCSACGQLNDDVAIKVQDRVSYYDVVGDNLFDLARSDRTGFLWLAPNRRREGYPRPDVNDEEEIHLDLRGVDPEAEMTWFKGAFADELKKLEEAYATVTVKWGLHQFFM